MKFSCLQENISKGLSINSHLAGSSRTSLPVLNNLLLSAEKGILKISATNLEIAIETKIRAKTEKKGDITIPAQIFSNYINLLPNEPLSFEKNKEELIIKSKNQKAKIKGISSEEFPIIPQIEKKEKTVIKSKIFKDSLEKTIFTISSSEIRNELSGALFSFNSPKENKLTIVGTDSYRLTEHQIKTEEISFSEKKEIIIPVKTLQEIARILGEEGNVEIYLSENQILFIYKETEIFSRVINGTYPDYKQTIPKTTNTEILINKQELLRTVKAAGFFSKIGINDINFKVLSKNNKLVISSLNNQVGENEAVLSADIKGKDNEIVFNYRYLIDGLINLPGDEAKIEIVDDDTPGLIKPTNDQSYLYLIMPIKNN
jgi:DNA polymerase III subunit beta